MLVAILHHIARYLSRIGVTTQFDNRWFITANQTIGGQHMTYQLPTDMFESLENVQTYTPNQIQRWISHNPDLSHIDVVAKDANV